MTKPTPPIFAAAQAAAERRADGSILLRNLLQPEPACGPTLMASLRTWAARTPDAVFLAERQGDGWRTLTFGEALARVIDISRRLAPLRLSEQRPLLVMAENGLDHAVVVLAAMRIGATAAVLSPAYATAGAHHDKIRGAIALLSPGAIYLGQTSYLQAVTAAGGAADAIWTMEGASGTRALAVAEPVDPAAADAAEASVGPDSIAKFLFTSGSTGAPKAVPNTQRMMTSNIDALSTIWPFVKRTPPRLADWLPWSHTFGGNVCFNLALCFGGSLYIDDGRPTPALLGKTLKNIQEVRPNVYFNVPQGYDALAPHLEADPGLAEVLLGETAFLFSGGAALPQSTRDRLEAIAARFGIAKPALIAGWGATETAPASTVAYFPSPYASNLGVPLPGVTLKLQPADGRYDLLVKGPNVTSGYWRRPDANAEAFDSEGFYRTGDAARFVDEAQPSAGLLFDGRTAENFKLRSGTWVNVGAVRLAAITSATPLVSDAVVCGLDEAEIGLLLAPNLAACRAVIGEASGLDDAAVTAHPAVIAAVGARLASYNEAQFGSSTRVGRFAFLAEPPDGEAGEVTEKGYLNQRLLLRRRAAEAVELYAQGHRVPSPAAVRPAPAVEPAGGPEP